MKVLFVGDIHNHKYMIDDIIRLDNKYQFDKIILFGDYIDDWNTTGKDSLETLDKIFSLKKNNLNKYTLLIGNHSLSYLGYPCSGHDYEYGQLITKKLLDNYNLLNVYEEIKLNNRNYICSHAGLTKPYIDLELKSIDIDWRKALNLIKEEKQFKYLKICSYIRGGRDMYSSLLWADKNEHINLLGFNEIYEDTKYQIIGHTPVTSVINYNKDNLYDYWFIDTHSTYRDGTSYGDKSYLIWNENKFERIN